MNDSVILGYARLWFAGKSSVAPGTVGSLVALVLAPFLFMPFPFWFRIVILLAVLWTGIRACHRAEEILQQKDPQEVVIDELFGLWVTFLPFAALGFWGYLMAFALFRLFDITKPWPVKNFEALPNGLGVMMDDAMAGLYAMLSFAVLRWVFL